MAGLFPAIDALTSGGGVSINGAEQPAHGTTIRKIRNYRKEKRSQSASFIL
jgi:hypothetical protein